MTAAGRPRPPTADPGPPDSLIPGPGVPEGMPEEVLFEDERRQPRAEVAAYLRSVAEKLESGGPITFTSGDRTVTVEPPERPTFEVKVERETAAGAAEGELSVELELEWGEGEADGDGELAIE